MSLTFVLVCVAVGVGTYLFRYLPTRLHKARPPAGLRGPLGMLLGPFMGSVGVAAVSALLAAALEPYVLELAGGSLAEPAAAAAGLVATVVSHRLWRDVAVSTLAGAVVFGVAWWLL